MTAENNLNREKSSSKIDSKTDLSISNKKKSDYIQFL